jgi:hypothetical protein
MLRSFHCWSLNNEDKITHIPLNRFRHAAGATVSERCQLINHNTVFSGYEGRGFVARW